MTTNKPEIAAWLHSARQDSDVITDKVRHVWGTPLGSMGQYTVALVRLSDYEALQAECEKLRMDAERYRWLRGNGAFAPDAWGNGWALACGSSRYSSIELDASVDAAMQPAEQHPAPDVAGLVEALQAISRNELDAQRAQHVAAVAIAAHRKQGGEV